MPADRPPGRYIHITNWDIHQHPDTLRGHGAMPWIKDFTAQLHDEDYLSLSWSDRGLLTSLRLQYAARRGRGINENTTSLYRLFGQKVTRQQLERLNHAGFIHFSASKLQAGCLHDASPEKRREETEREEETETEKQQQSLNSTRTVNGRGHKDPHPIPNDPWD